MNEALTLKKWIELIEESKINISTSPTTATSNSNTNLQNVRVRIFDDEHEIVDK